MTYSVDDTDVDESFTEICRWRNRLDGLRRKWNWSWLRWRWNWRSEAFACWNAQASLRTRRLGLTNWYMRIFDRVFRIRSWFCSNGISTRNGIQICEQTVLFSLYRLC